MSFNDIIKKIVNILTACFNWIKGAIVRPAGTLVWVSVIMLVLHVAKINIGFIPAFLILLFNLFACVINYIQYKSQSK